MPRESRRGAPAVFAQHHEANNYSPRRSMYNLYRNTGPDEYKHGMMMEVVHEPDLDAYYYPPTDAPTGVSQRMNFSGHTTPDLGQGALDDYESSDVQGKPKLFGHGHKSGQSTITYMEGTKQSRVHALTVGMMAVEDTMSSHGRELQVDDDRSGHSEHLVQNLTRKLGKQFSERTRTNDLDFLPEQPSPVNMVDIAEGRGPSLVSLGRVDRARLQGREIAAGGPKYGPEKPEHEQLTLF